MLARPAAHLVLNRPPIRGPDQQQTSTGGAATELALALLLRRRSSGHFVHYRPWVDAPTGRRLAEGAHRGSYGSPQGDGPAGNRQGQSQSERAPGQANDLRPAPQP